MKPDLPLPLRVAFVVPERTQQFLAAHATEALLVAVEGRPHGEFIGAVAKEYAAAIVHAANREPKYIEAVAALRAWTESNMHGHLCGVYKRRPDGGMKECNCLRQRARTILTALTEE